MSEYRSPFTQNRKCSNCGTLALCKRFRNIWLCWWCINEIGEYRNRIVQRMHSERIKEAV